MEIKIRGSAPLFQVYDMPASLAFYRDNLGFTLLNQSTPERGDDCDWALLALDGIEIMLNTAYEKPHRPPAPDASRIAAHGDTTIYFGCPDTNGLYHYLRSRSLDVEPPSLTGYGFMAITLCDPDGYGLCFHWPANETAAPVKQ